jgi:hypothetical protein
MALKVPVLWVMALKVPVLWVMALKVLVFQRDVLPVSLQFKLNPEDGSCRMLSKGWLYD